MITLRTKQFLKTLYKGIAPILIVVLSPFYKRKYLKGKWFERSYKGFIWAFQGIFWQKMCGFNRHIPWPVSPFITISNGKNIIFDPDDLNNFQGSGVYFQNFNGKIFVGKGTYIANNVGIITSNHDIYSLDNHMPGKDIKIGDKCWIGMNSVVLPGVTLGTNTIVGAGSVVTKSFLEGHCIIAGNPAKIIRRLEDVVDRGS